MRAVTILTVCCSCLFPGISAFAQETPLEAQKPQEEVQRPKLPVIPDEPKTVDPATLVPKMLAQKVTVEFEGTSLKEVADWIKENAGVTVVFDTQQFGSNGSLLDTIDEKLDDEPLYLLFNRLSSLGLAWYEDDDLIYVTSAAAAKSRMVTRSYSLSDLIDAGYETHALSTCIYRSFPEGNWNMGGSVGNAEMGQLEWLADVMFVRQNEEIHRKILGLLEALRTPSRMRFAYDPPQHEALREALEKNISVDYEDTPLVEVVDDLVQQTGVDVRLDSVALRTLRIREREPITLTLADRKLSSALRVLLARLKLTWTIDDGVMWITDDSRANRNFKVAVYRVDDLCRDDSEMAALFQAVKNQTKGAWNSNPGTLNITVGEIQGPKVGVMAVRQTEPVLQQIDQLLTNYRAALLQSKLRKKEGESPEDVITQYYRLFSPVAEDLQKFLPRLVEPKSWKSDDNPDGKGEILMKIASDPDFDLVVEASPELQSLASNYSILIIRHERQIHEKIWKVITRIENGDPNLAEQGGGMGGMGGFGGGFFQVAPLPKQKLPETRAK